MSNIIPFSFEGQTLNIATGSQGEPWFSAKEICSILGFANARQAIDTHVDSDDVQKLDVMDTLGRTQRANHINEYGLYALILGSTKPEAKRFKRWVTHEVLPEIRKTGSFKGIPSTSPLLRNTVEAAKAFPPFFRIARLLGCDRNAAAISANQAVLQLSQVNLLQGLGQTHLEAANQESAFFTPTELGKRIGTSARGVNLLLAEAGMQMKRGDVWEVTDAGREFARIYDTGKKHGSGVPVTQIKWSSTVLPVLGQEREAA
jgi:prophage antirepressor-like protein